MGRSSPVVIIAFSVIAGFTARMPQSKATAGSKRPADDTSYTGRVPKQQLTTDLADKFRQQAKTLLCPFTKELPDNPVRAQDGILYDRKAIENYFNCVPGECIDSPVTLESMGKSLEPAADVMDMFKNSIITGQWQCEHALAWLLRRNEKNKDEAKVTELQMGAEKGDPNMMYDFANALYNGWYDLEEDAPTATKWYEEAADKGHASACATYGILLIHGLMNSRLHESDKKETLGVSYLMASALLGSETGCFEIGLMFKDGLRGYPKDEHKARVWMGRMHDCKHRDADDNRRQAASAFLTPS